MLLAIGAFSAPPSYRSLQGQQIVESKIYFGFEARVSFFRSQEKVAVIRQQPKTQQWKVQSYLETTNNKIIRCLKEGLVSFLSSTKGKLTMVKIGSQWSYKRNRIEGSKIWHNDVHKNVLKRQSSSLTNK